MTEITDVPAAAYTVDADTVLGQLETRPEGLASSELASRRERYGVNRLPSRRPPSLLMRFLRQFRDPLIYVLLAAFVVTLLLGHLLDSAVIFAVLFLNALIGTLQEGKAENALAAIRKLLRLQAKVRRDGKWLGIDAEELVLGDILQLRSGDRVPADLRADESLLRGIHLTGVSDLPPGAVRRRSFQTGRMPAFSRRIGRNSLWVSCHDKIMVAHRLMVDGKLQSSVEEHPAAM